MATTHGSRPKSRASTRRNTHGRLPIDPTLRARAEKMFAHYRMMEEPPATKQGARQKGNKPHGITEMVVALRPDMVKALARSLNAYDASMLSMANQKKFCAVLKKTVELEGF